MTTHSATLHSCYPDTFILDSGEKIWSTFLKIDEGIAHAFMVGADKKLGVRIKLSTEDFKYINEGFTVVRMEPAGLLAVYKQEGDWYLIRADMGEMRQWVKENPGAKFSEFMCKRL